GRRAVGVRLARQRTETLPDLGFGGIPSDAEQPVVVNVSRHLAGTSTALRTIATEGNIGERKGFGQAGACRRRTPEPPYFRFSCRIFCAEIRTPSGRLRSRDTLRRSRMFKNLISGSVIASGTAGLLTSAS